MLEVLLCPMHAGGKAPRGHIQLHSSLYLCYLYNSLLQGKTRWLEQYCRKFAISIPAKHKLYLSLVRSHLSYCSPVWRPQHARDTCTVSLERVQRPATKYILNDYTHLTTSLVFALYTFSHWCTTLSYAIWCFSLKTSNIFLKVSTLKTTSHFPTVALGLPSTTNWHTTKQQHHLIGTSTSVVLLAFGTLFPLSISPHLYHLLGLLYITNLLWLILPSYAHFTLNALAPSAYTPFMLQTLNSFNRLSAK